MIQKEKVKAYDEAIENAENILHTSEFAKITDIFSKLVESEDERIREGLIAMLSHDKDLHHKEIAYLEKLKDASKAIETVERIDKYIDENLANAHDMKNSNPNKKYYRGWDDALGKIAGILQDVYSNEKQKEQKPVEPSDDELQRHQDKLYEFKVFAAKQAKEHHISYVHDFEWNNFCAELLSYFNEQQKEEEGYEVIPVESTLEYKLGFKAGKESEKQKHDWSEEDREMLTRCVAAIPVQGDEILPTSYLNKLRNWLESLPERINLQSKREWGEKDKLMYKLLRSIVRGTYVIQLQETQDELLSWIKSIIENFVSRSKQEWSEDDKIVMLNTIITDVNRTLHSCGIGTDEWNIRSKAIRWLKSLPERFNLQPKQEWSEEDEERIQSILFFIGYCKDKYPNKKDYLKDINWLKSIRLQSKTELTLLDENIINAAVAFVEQNDHFNCWRGIDKHTVIKALHSLKSHWKPSEQEKGALRTAIHILTEERNFPKAAAQLQNILNAFEGDIMVRNEFL